MGEILDAITALGFVCLVVPKTVIVSRFYSIAVPHRVLWLASVGSFVISLAALLIITTISLPFIVGMAYDFSSQRWPRAGLLLTGYLIVTIVPGLLYERRTLSRGGVDKSSASRICLVSSLYLLIAIAAVILAFYLIAMKYF